LTTSIFFLVPVGSEMISDSVQLNSRDWGGVLTSNEGDRTSCEGSTSWLRGTTVTLLVEFDGECACIPCLRPSPSPSPNASATRTTRRIPPSRDLREAGFWVIGPFDSISEFALTSECFDCAMEGGRVDGEELPTRNTTINYTAEAAVAGCPDERHV
jgi:hypothetical protein